MKSCEPFIPSPLEFWILFPLGIAAVSLYLAASMPLEIQSEPSQIEAEFADAAAVQTAGL